MVADQDAIYFLTADGYAAAKGSPQLEALKAHGVEVLWVSQEKLAAKISKAIADAAGLTNRGAKYRGDLAFLNNTTKPAVLIEVLFCDNQGDTDAYRSEFNAICEAIARSIAVI